jgi:hypothetical protein
MGKPPIPKEHGAWALLCGPFILALTVTPGYELKVLALLVAMSSLFLGSCFPLLRQWDLLCEDESQPLHKTR